MASFSSSYYTTWWTFDIDIINICASLCGWFLTGSTNSNFFFSWTSWILKTYSSEASKKSCLSLSIWASACKVKKECRYPGDRRRRWLPGSHAHLNVFGIWLMVTSENFWLRCGRIFCVGNCVEHNMLEHLWKAGKDQDKKHTLKP